MLLVASTALLSASLLAPAFGAPKAVSAASLVAKLASTLKIAKRADGNARRALAKIRARRAARAHRAVRTEGRRGGSVRLERPRLPRAEGEDGTDGAPGQPGPDLSSTMTPFTTGAVLCTAPFVGIGIGNPNPNDASGHFYRMGGTMVLHDSLTVTAVVYDMFLENRSNQGTCSFRRTAVPSG